MIVQIHDRYVYEQMVEDLEALAQRFPFIAVESIGLSACGKPLLAARIGQGKCQLHYNGSFHANEWITSLLLMKFLEQYAQAYATGQSLHGYSIQELYAETSLWIVPMVNPDGVNLVLEGEIGDEGQLEQVVQWNDGSTDFSQWKANARGVDLNDQFPAEWEREKERRSPEGPSPRDYVGPSPLSEPEAIAMYNFTRCHDFELVMAFHTQGEEIYWNYNDHEPAYAEGLAAQLAELSTYRAIKLTGSDAGYKDWFIQEYGRPGFTIEAGYGENPLPLTDFPTIYDKVQAIMLAGLQVAAELPKLRK